MTTNRPDLNLNNTCALEVELSAHLWSVTMVLDHDSSRLYGEFIRTITLVKLSLNRNLQDE